MRQLLHLLLAAQAAATGLPAREARLAELQQLQAAQGNGSWWSPCKVEPFPLAIPYYLNVSSCAAGYYCPNLVPDDPLTYPQVCPATPDCVAQRLAGKFCEPQGMYEPVLCQPGHYCPNSTLQLPCEAGTFCLRGSTKPAPCVWLEDCPALTEKGRFYGGIIVMLIMDAAIALGFLWGRRVVEPRIRAARAGAWKSRFAASTSGDSGSSSELAVPLLGGEAGGDTYVEMTDSGSPPATHEGLRRRAGGLPKPAPVSSYAIEPPDLVEAKRILAHGFRRCNAGLSIEIGFTDLTYRLPPPLNKTILSGVSGLIRPHRTVAVLGASGAGKSTFLNVLMGKLPRTAGSLAINGRPAEIHFFRKVQGFVPQSDTCIRDLTVRENILFSARMRLPHRGWTERDIQLHVDAVLRVLGLTECADTRVGNELDRGVSGGQLKRTNVGIELAASPAALFLDEPTSGLDSSAALEVCETLRAVANLGLTVVSIIHQPRYLIFKSFDDVLLLAPGGVTAYMGPRNLVQPYFEYLGFRFEPNSNPADDLLDFIAGKLQPLPGPLLTLAASAPAGSPTSALGPALVAEFWRLYGHGVVNSGTLRPTRDLADTLSELAAEGSADSGAATPTKGAAGPGAAAALPLLPASSPLSLPASPLPSNLTVALETVASPLPAGTAGSLQAPHDSGAAAGSLDAAGIGALTADRGARFWRQLWLVHNRSLLQQYRQPTTFILEMGVVSVAGLMMGSAASYLPELYQGVLKQPYAALSPSPMEIAVPQLGLYVALAVGIAGAPAGVLTFGEEKAVYYREASAGHDRLAYYIGKTLAVLYRFTAGALHFGAVFAFLAKPSTSFPRLFLIIWTCFFCVYGLSAVVSMLVRRENAALLAVIVALVAGTLSGYGPSLAQMAANGLEWVCDASYARWLLEAFYDQETLPYRDMYMVAASFWGYTLNRFNTDILVAFGIGAGYRILAYFLLIGLNRDKQR